MRPRNLNEVQTGAFLVLVALAALFLSWPLSSRTDIALGPGFLPKVLATILLAMGTVMMLHGLRWGAPEAHEPYRLRPIVLVLASVGFFAATIESLGLVVALIGLVIIACLGDRTARLWETLLVTAGAVVISILLFVKALGLQMRIWPGIF